MMHPNEVRTNWIIMPIDYQELYSQTRDDPVLAPSVCLCFYCCQAEFHSCTLCGETEWRCIVERRRRRGQVGWRKTSVVPPWVCNWYSDWQDGGKREGERERDLIGAWRESRCQLECAELSACRKTAPLSSTHLNLQGALFAASPLQLLAEELLSVLELASTLTYLVVTIVVFWANND